MAGRAPLVRAEPGFTLPFFERLAPPPPPALVEARIDSLAKPGDVVLIAGKGHELGQEVAGRISPFDDREVARQALRAERAGA